METEPASAGTQTSGLQLRYRRLSPAATPPAKATPDAAAYDLASSETCVVSAGSVRAVSTHLELHFPKGHYGRILGRSGLSLHNVDTTAGLIDPDFCGEIKIVLRNLSRADFVVVVGQRVAQLLVSPIVDLELVEASSELAVRTTDRGRHGFGSTGDHSLQAPQSDA